MIIVHAVNRCKPERRDEHVAALLAAQRATNENDEGCLHYRFVADLEDPCLFTCVELWQDSESLRAHLAAPHLEELRAVLAETAAERGEVKAFEAEPRPMP